MGCTHEMVVGDSLLIFNGLSMDLYKIPNEPHMVEEFYSKYDDTKGEVFQTIQMERLNRLTLCISSTCNLACKYCYEAEENYGKSNCLMNKEVLEKTIEYVYDLYPKGVNIIQFFGGEPLLNFELLRYAVEYITEQAKLRNIKEPMFTIVTNGTLITEEVHEIFNKYFKRITISLDGKQQTNDANRCYRDTSLGSVFETVASKIQKFSKNRNYYVDIQMTVTEKHLQNDEAEISDYLELKKLGVSSIHITPLINTKGYSVSQQEEYNKKLIKYFSLCYDEELKNVNQSNYYKLLGQVKTLKEKRAADHYCGAGFNDISVDVNGDIYPCFMFNGNKKFVMGNVERDKRQFMEARQTYMDNIISKNEKCNHCWAKKICTSGHAGCIGAFYLENGDISTPIQSNCELTKFCLDRILSKIASYK